jgi:ER lumen protein retaining receptor
LLSFIILIQKIKTTRNCLGFLIIINISTGISYRTQEIYLVVFLARYWDLLLYFVSVYNTSMKILYIICTLYIIFVMRFKKPYCLVIQ